MLNQSLKDFDRRSPAPQVQTPAQYIGGEWNSTVKDHRPCGGRLCLAFPDTYSIGMSHHGLQVLYDLMNRARLGLRTGLRPMADMEQLLREHRLPLCGLETFTPLTSSTCSASRCNTTCATATC